MLPILGYNIAKAPLYFVRSGVVRIYQGNFGEGGDNIILWSQTAGFFKANNLNDAHAFQLRLASLTVNTSFDANRWHGLPLRCLQPLTTIQGRLIPSQKKDVRTRPSKSLNLCEIA